MNDGRAKVRILFVVHDIDFFVSHRLKIASAAIEQGLEAHLAGPSYTVSSGSKARLDGLDGLVFHHVQFQKPDSGLLGETLIWARLFVLYRRLKPDILHHIAIRAILYGSFAASLSRMSVVVNAFSGLGYIFTGDTVKKRLLRLLLRIVLRFAIDPAKTAYIFQNEHDREVIQRFEPHPKVRTFLLKGSGVELERFWVGSRDREPTIVLMAARLLRDKGVTEFAEAANILHDRKVPVRMVLVGAISLGNPSALTIEEVAIMTENSTMEWWGSRSDIPDILAKASIGCLPSYREGFPKFLSEAAAASLPIVTTDVPGCRDAVDDGVTGFCVPSHDPGAIAEKIELLARDRELRMRMGAAALEKVSKESDIRKIALQTLSIYEKMDPSCIHAS